MRGERLTMSFVQFPFVSPLLSLLRVASDYPSGSAVCLGILRPLRPLHEIKDKSNSVFHAKSAEIFLSVFTLALEESQTSLRQESAEKLSTPSPPAGYSPLSQGEKVGDSVSQFSVFTFISSPTLIKLKQSPLLIKLRKSVFRLLCPPETGGTSAERGGGG